MNWVAIAAVAERVRERVVLAFHRVRVLLLWWLLGIGTRSMFLLRSGIWVDCSRGFTPDQVRAVYNAETHSVVPVGSSLPLGSRDRWPWLAAVETSGAQRDLGDFFGSLRVAGGLGVTSADVIRLFVYQKGWMPQGDLSVIQRDGTDTLVDATTGHPVEAVAPSSSVNYVR